MKKIFLSITLFFICLINFPFNTRVVRADDTREYFYGYNLFYDYVTPNQEVTISIYLSILQNGISLDPQVDSFPDITWYLEDVQVGIIKPLTNTNEYQITFKSENESLYKISTQIDSLEKEVFYLPYFFRAPKMLATSTTSQDYLLSDGIGSVKIAVSSDNIHPFVWSIDEPSVLKLTDHQLFEVSRDNIQKSMTCNFEIKSAGTATLFAYGRVISYTVIDSLEIRPHVSPSVKIRVFSDIEKVEIISDKPNPEPGEIVKLKLRINDSDTLKVNGVDWKVNGVSLPENGMEAAYKVGADEKIDVTIGLKNKTYAPLSLVVNNSKTPIKEKMSSLLKISISLVAIAALLLILIIGLGCFTPPLKIAIKLIEKNIKKLSLYVSMKSKSKLAKINELKRIKKRNYRIEKMLEAYTFDKASNSINSCITIEKKIYKSILKLMADLYDDKDIDEAVLSSEMSQNYTTIINTIKQVIASDNSAKIYSK